MRVSHKGHNQMTILVRRDIDYIILFSEFVPLCSLQGALYPTMGPYSTNWLRFLVSALDLLQTVFHLPRVHRLLLASWAKCWRICNRWFRRGGRVTHGGHMRKWWTTSRLTTSFILRNSNQTSKQAHVFSWPISENHLVRLDSCSLSDCQFIDKVGWFRLSTTETCLCQTKFNQRHLPISIYGVRGDPILNLQKKLLFAYESEQAFCGVPRKESFDENNSPPIQLPRHLSCFQQAP